MSAEAVSQRKSNALQAIVWGGLACGVLDLTAACATWAIRGVRPSRILQSIASGLLGAKAYQGGWGTAALGVALHFVIAFGATAVFFAVSRKLVFLTQRAVVWGLVYGVAVFVFMDQIVLPLSAFQKSPFSMTALIIALITHMLCVGLPISLAVRRYSSGKRLR